MRVALDSNVLLYAEGLNGAERREQMETLLRQLIGRTYLPPQVLGEFYNVLVRKGRREPEEVRERMLHWRQISTLLQLPADSILAAAELASRHRLGIWDAAVVVAADIGRCEVLLSEDLQHGFCWRGVTVINPFAVPRHPLLESAIANF